MMVIRVRRFDSFKDERRVYLLLDFVGGGSLHDHLSATGAFEDATAQYYTAQVTIALGAHASVVGIVVTRSRASVEALHEAKVAHGALSTEHVMLDVHGHVVLVSLAGAARFERVVVPPARRRARLQPHCAAPERFRNEPASAAADLWALGCLIYEMLTAYVYQCVVWEGNVIAWQCATFSVRLGVRNRRGGARRRQRASREQARTGGCARSRAASGGAGCEQARRSERAWQQVAARNRLEGALVALGPRAADDGCGGDGRKRHMCRRREGAVASSRCWCATG
jgi:hypothetical protein